MCVWTAAGDDVTGVVARVDKVAGSMERLLGGECYHYHSKLMMKEGRTGGAHLWHQATSFHQAVHRPDGVVQEYYTYHTSCVIIDRPKCSINAGLRLLVPERAAAAGPGVGLHPGGPVHTAELLSPGDPREPQAGQAGPLPHGGAERSRPGQSSNRQGKVCQSTTDKIPRCSLSGLDTTMWRWNRVTCCSSTPTCCIPRTRTTATSGAG